MHVKAECKHFTWKKISLIVDLFKVDQNILIEPSCDLNKQTCILNCPKKCKWYEH